VKPEDETALLVLVGLWLYAQASDLVPRAVKALEHGGARAYDALHNDAQHQKDLPRPERMESQPPIVKQRHARVLALANAAGFPNPELAAAIAMAESGGKADSVARSSREHSVGLWQINVLAHKQYSPADLLDPETNARAAFSISHGGKDWRPWAAYTNGSYKRFL
jgi:hypothetical protein